MNEAEYHQLAETNSSVVVQLLLEKDREILKLQQHLINANNARFGSKSEKLQSSHEQFPLFPVKELEEPETIVIPEHERKVKRTRRELPKDTVVVQIKHPPVATECPCCNAELVQIREEITEILNYVPARFELEQHVKPVMVCKSCKEKAPQTTTLPLGVQLIPRSPAGVGLLSHILISKFQDHLPLFRLEGMFARLGYELPRQRMSDWLGHVAELLHPLYQVLKSELLPQSYLQADETTIKVQDGEEAGRCQTGYLWGILSPALNLSYFHYADTRSGDVPRSLLSGFKGILQTDLYAGYNTVYVPEQAIRAGCWAHVRRKFLEIRKLASESDVGKALELIAKLYHLEAKSKKLEAEALLAVRQKHSKLILEKLHTHLSSWGMRALPGSVVLKAINYALTQWSALTLFMNDAKLKLDNNLIENQMRPVALGRKNWLFAGSHEGAMRAAIFFSLINSCKLHRVNTWRYFNDVLKRIQSTPRDQLVNLLPDRWTPIVK